MLCFLTNGAGFIKRSGASTDNIVPKSTELLGGSSSHQQPLRVLFPAVDQGTFAGLPLLVQLLHPVLLNGDETVTHLTKSSVFFLTTLFHEPVLVTDAVI